MDYLERHLPFKYNPALLLKDCRSLLLMGLNYYQPLPVSVPQGAGQIALYAWGRDYHKVLQHKLKALEKKLKACYPEAGFLAGVDTTPLQENFFAARAGLGWQGKNTLLINPRYGSWFVIGELLSTLPVSELQQLIALPAAASEEYRFTEQKPRQTAMQCPPGCTLCQKACPTQALYAPYQLNAARCISYLTIEYKKELEPADWPLLQNWLFGCDLCQRVCPFNRRARQTKEQDFLRQRSGGLLSLASVLEIQNAEEYKKLFAGSPLMRAGRSRLLRNAIIVAVNTRTQDLIPLIKKLSADTDPLIAWHARQAEQFF
jgi:epoxyqueuosine reductase